MKVTKVRQIDVARATDVSYQTVSAWITGRGYPRADAMEKLCKFFGIKQSALTEKKDKIIDEDVLLGYFRAMSETGRNNLIERAKELVQIYPKRKRGRKNAET